MIAVLDLIGTQIRENYQRIHTWSGMIETEVTLLHTGKNAEETE
jgi:hypothetical protein